MERTKITTLLIGISLLYSSLVITSEQYNPFSGIKPFELSGMKLFELFRINHVVNGFLPESYYPLPLFLGVFNGQKFLLFGKTPPCLERIIPFDN